jgi:predicted ATPase/DNA-binding SARP family transcriptional activator
VGWTYSVLGPLEVHDGERLVELTRAKDRLLLGTLLIHANQVVSTDRLLDVLWNERPPASGLKALQFHVSSLRDTLQPGRSGASDTPLKTQAPGYMLEVADDAVDAHRFRLLVDDARSVSSFDPVESRRWLTEAMLLWRGPALADFAYADIAAAEIQSLEEERLGAIELLYTVELALDRHVDAIPALSSLTTDHPYREQLHGLLISALYRAGRQADAIAVGQELRRRLRDDLGIDPSPDLVALESDVLLQSASLLAHFVPVRDLVDPANLPAHLTTFIGRQVELAEVSALLIRHRLVTITGTGGAGKTRLAVEVAGALPQALVNGVAFVDLAAVVDPELVDQTVFASVGAKETANRSVRDSLVLHLSGRNLLIVLDNCEHVVGAAGSIADHLLSNVDSVRVLATSQQVLKLPGEKAYPLPPMATSPTPGDDGLLSDAARLFLDHAQRARPDFVSLSSDGADIAAIVRQLDGSPLAIELAAARVRMMTVSDIAARLGDRLRLLTDGSSSLGRQQTLEAAVTWSYNLTQGAERELFDLVSIFATSFSHEAVAVIGEIDDVIEVFELLGLLVDKSLVVVDVTGGDMRYRLLETLREFGSARLDERGDLQRVAERHATYHLDLVRDGNELLNGDDQALWHGRFRKAIPDIRKALVWLLAERPDDALTAATGLGCYWWREGTNTEGMEWLQRALAVTSPASSGDRADALTWLSTHLFFVGLIDDALRVGIEAVAMAREVGDYALLSAALNRVGGPLWNQGQLRDAIECFEESVDAQVQAGEQPPPAVLWNIGISYLELGDPDGAGRTAQRMRDECVPEADPLMAPNADFLECNIAIVRGDLEAARYLAQAALAAYTDLDRMSDMADINERLAEISDLQGDLDQTDHHLKVLARLRSDQGPEHQSRANLIRARRARAGGDFEAAKVCLRVTLQAAVDRQQPVILSSIFHETSLLAFDSGDLNEAAALTGAVRRIAGDPGVTLAQYVLDQARWLRRELAVSVGSDTAEYAMGDGAAMETSDALEVTRSYLA